MKDMFIAELKYALPAMKEEWIQIIELDNRW